jgi:hypothetical protein
MYFTLFSKESIEAGGKIERGKWGDTQEDREREKESSQTQRGK